MHHLLLQLDVSGAISDDKSVQLLFKVNVSQSCRKLRCDAVFFSDRF